VQPGIFRQQALDRLSSPDQLDQTMRIADPKRWIALAAVGVLLLGGLVWGFLGRIDSSVQAECVIIPRGGTYRVVTTTAGTVYDLFAERGDRLDEGEVVAVVQTIDGSRVDVVAPFSGEVVELLATYGDFVDVGEDILDFTSDEEALGVLLYLPATVSGQIQPGMEVRISPVTARREQFGFLVGRIVEVAPFPSTPDGMTALLNNDTLAQRLFSSADDTPVEVWVEPEAASTPSGFRWSSSDGPDTPLRSGTLCSADIVLAERRPIDLIRP